MQSNTGKQIMATILESAGDASPRTLYIFANPLGNAVGDTVIATQHIPFLKFIPGNKITVWTADGEIWKALCGSDLTTTPTVTEQEILHDFDLIFFDWVNCGSDLMKIAERSRAIIFNWTSRTTHMKVRINGGAFQEISLPVSTNHPSRIAELYDTLKWEAVSTFPHKQDRKIHSGIPCIYFNPYASTSEKSMKRPLAVRLLKSIIGLCASDTSIIIGPVPNATSEVDRLEFERIRVSIDRVCCDMPNISFQAASLSNYIDTVQRAMCVLSPDTSTQHIAALYGTPSVVFYPNRREYNHFAFGWLDSDVYSLKMLEEPDHCGLIDLVRCLFKSIINEVVMVDSRVSSALTAFRASLLCVEDKGFFTLEGQKERKHALLQLDAALPEAWNPYLMPELARAVKELEYETVLDVGGLDFVIRRIRSMAALKILDKMYYCREA